MSYEHAGRIEAQLKAEVVDLQAKVQEVVTSLGAFCERIQGRPDNASFADQLAIL